MVCFVMACFVTEGVEAYFNHKTGINAASGDRVIPPKAVLVKQCQAKALA
jgi:hypothetical protein